MALKFSLRKNKQIVLKIGSLERQSNRKRKREREREGERENSSPLVLSSNICNGIWLEFKPRTRNSIQVSYAVTGTQLLEPEPAVS